MKILLSGGGTGGHIYPALALMNYIKAQDPSVEFLYVGTQKGLESKIVPSAGYPFQTIKMQGLKRSLSIENLRTAYYMIKSISDAKKIIKEFKPDIIIGTGGYVCAPVLYAGAKLHIPTIIHEQNSVAGVTNKFLARYVSKIAICFEDVQNDFQNVKEKIVLTGNPRGQEVLETEPNHELIKELGLDPKIPLVVIFGGSRGAPSINKAFVEAYPLFDDKDYQVLMVTGEEHYPVIEQAIASKQRQLKNVHIFPYMKDMPSLFQSASLVVCRSGATTLTELTSLGLASILIPSPYVTNNHQESNAQTLVNKGAARMILQADLTGTSFIDAVDGLMAEPDFRNKMSQAAKQLGINDASVRLWKLIQDLLV